MGPPRRNPPHGGYKVNGSSVFINQAPSPQASYEPSASQSPPSLGMSPESRYQHNLKVLRRRDPSIISIFDQFSHVCVYHHDGKKWEKHGYEGSMFLFERDAYPPYGFYILNRMGMEDYIQGIYPEDDVGASGSYLIIRSYPEFMSNRLASIQVLLQGKPTPDKFSDIYAIPNISELTPQSKGESKIVGLWMFATDAREPMIDIMKRLHSYVKRNVPYPEEFRYGPVRPPPPHRLRAVTKSASSRQATSSEASDSQTSYSDSEGSVVSSQVPLSEVDKLFAKFVPTPTHSAPPMASYPNKTSNPTVESLFAALGSSNLAHSVPTSPAPSSTGISLLDNIFASATALSATPLVANKTKIFSPTPTTSALPQVLNQDVISTLLGLPPSRTASAASTYSTGARSHATSREGDNEADSDSNLSAWNGQRSTQSEGTFSESGTIYGSVPGNRLEPPPVSESSFLAVPGLHEQGRNNLGRINGDVTPRAFTNGTHGKAEGMIPVPSVLEAASSISTVRGSQPSNSTSASQESSATAKKSTKPRANRPLVPFEPESELWPYPRSATGEPAMDFPEGEEAEIVELDFEDTSVLSDPDAFLRVLKSRGSSRNDRIEEGILSTRNGKEKGKGRKKNRKEREAREKVEIENSWDVPGVKFSLAPHHLPVEVYHQQALASPPASPSPPPSPPPIHAPSSDKRPQLDSTTPTMRNKPTSVSMTNGHPAIQPPAVVPSGKAKKAHLNGGSVRESKVDVDTVKDSIIAAVQTQVNPIGILERNEFVREVLTLIHTDKIFVDNLWQEYRARLA